MERSNRCCQDACHGHRRELPGHRTVCSCGGWCFQRRHVGRDADDWGQISARIKLATQTQDEFTLAQSRLMDIANRTYSDYTEAADQFAGILDDKRHLFYDHRIAA